MLNIQKNLTNSFFALLSLPATAMGFALSVQIAALSWILSTKYGLNEEDIGLVWAAGPIAGILGQVLIGIISDNVWFWNGRRRPFILIGGFLAAMMLLALPNIDIISKRMGMDGILAVAITVALTLDLAINVSFNPTRSIIADVTPEGKERTKGYTWMQTISGTFGMMAYVIGTVWDNYTLIYFGAGLVFVLSVFPAFFIEEPRELKSNQENEVAQTSSSFSKIIMDILPLWGFLIYGIYAISKRIVEFEIGNYYVEIGCFILTVILFAYTFMQSDQGVSKAEAGRIGFLKVLAAHSFTWVGVQSMFIYMFSFGEYRFPTLSDDDLGDFVNISFLILNGVAAILPVLVLEPITRRIGRVNTHLICIAIMALGYFGIRFMGYTPTTIYILMAVLGIGWAATISLPFAIMSQKVDQSRMGMYMGLFNLSVVLPQLVASLGVGKLINEVEDKSLVFVICGATLAISAISWLFVKEDKQDEPTTIMPSAGH